MNKAVKTEALEIPKLEESFFERHRAIIAEGLLLSQLVFPTLALTGCSSEKPPPLVPAKTLLLKDNMSSVNRIYESLGEKGNMGALLTAAGVAGKLTAEQIKSQLSEAPTSGDAAGILVLAAAESGKSMSEITQMWQEAPTVSNRAALMVLAATQSGKSMSQIQEMWDASPVNGVVSEFVGNMSGEPADPISAQLVYAAALSGKSMGEITSMWKSAESVGDNAAVLVTAAALSGKSMTEINTMWKNAASVGTTSVQLVLAAALSGKSIEAINLMWKENPNANLVIVCALADLEMSEVNLMVKNAKESWGTSTSDLVTLTLIDKILEKSPSLVVTPIITTSMTRSGYQSWDVNFHYTFAVTSKPVQAEPPVQAETVDSGSKK